MIAFELKRQYPQMDISVVEMKNVVKLAEGKFVPGNEHLGVKFISGQVVDINILLQILKVLKYILFQREKLQGTKKSIVD